MNLNFLCCIGAELKNSVQQTTRMTQVYLYRAFEEETIADMLATGFFNDALGIIRQDDLLLLYSPNETKSKYVYARVSDVSSAGVVIEVIKIDASTISVDTTGYSNITGNNLQEVLQSIDSEFDKYVKKDGSSVMTGPLKFRAGSFVGAIAGGLGDGISFYKLKSDNTIDSEVASLTKTNGFTPGTTNTQDIGSSSLKWKDLYVARVIASVLNNGANINIPTTGGTLGLNDFSNITDSAKNIGNWSSNVSNCITEIPQDIKLEIFDNNGTLTLRLKSGSKLYKPNGTGVFEPIPLDADKTYSTTSNGTYVLVLTSSNVFDIVKINNTYSGNSAPTGIAQFSLWYDTANNLIKKTNDSGSTWSTGGISFPICIFTSTNSGISSIDQVFNGFGYVGSTLYVLPGVQGLYPNGRNTDGTLKSGAINITGVKTYTVTATTTTAIRISSSGLSGYRGYIVSDTKPSANFNMWYNPSENIMYDTGSGTPSVLYTSIAATIIYDGTRITSFVPKTVFHAVDYNDTEFIAYQAMPSDRYIALSTSVSSGYNYTAPADGYLSINKSGAAGDWLYMRNTTNGLNVGVQYTGSYNGRLFIPVQKGHVIQVQFQGSGTVNEFRFIYANGSK